MTTADAPGDATPGSRAEYERRMHRVLEHIDRHLDQPLDLPALAAVANFSPFHFHRLATAWLGETPGDYLRRRRLEQAATRLRAQPRLEVLQVALAVGFGSGEAFARAFKLRFGCSPSAWRARREESNPDQAPHAGGGKNESSNPARELPMKAETKGALKVDLLDRPSETVAYLRHVGPYGESVVDFWRGTAFPWLAGAGLLAAARYGISHDDPSVTEPRLRRYDAGARIDDGSAPPPPALSTRLPGGRYGVLRFRGTASELLATWDAMLRDWLPGSGLQLDARPMFEHYPPGAGYDPATGVFDCEVCVPVAPL